MILQPYAVRTGTKTNLAFFRANRWRLLVSARGRLRDEGFPFALDNGAWTSFSKGEPFDADAFDTALNFAAGREDWVVIPDVVADRDGTISAARSWIPKLKGRKLLLVAQDGMSSDDIDEFVPDIHGVFVGGSTEWKEASMLWLADYARKRGIICHAGRINSRRKLAICVDAGVSSFDGSGPSRFLKHAELMQRWLEELGATW